MTFNRVGDVLETVNGIDLQNAEHVTAVQAVKESKGLLDIVSVIIIIIIMQNKPMQQ